MTLSNGQSSLVFLFWEPKKWRPEAKPIAQSHSMKLWAAPCRATQDEWVTLESSDKHGPLEKNGKPLQYSCLENPMNSMKRQKDIALKDELPRSVGAEYTTGEEWRNSSRKNEGMEPKQKQHPLVDVTGDGSNSNAVKINTA